MVSEVAGISRSPYRVLQKQRRGDWDVRITIPDLGEFHDKTPLLVDDIVSSGVTMIEGARLLRTAGLPSPYCVAVHALFDDATGARIESLTRAFLTTDTVPNKYSHFRVAPLIAEQLSSNCE